jgi:DNA polymerase-3 subunit epsilon
MEHPNPKHRNESILWAREILKKSKEHVILDTETTGLGENDVIVQLAIIDFDGNVLIDSLVRPTKRKRMSSQAQSIHGISMKMLEDAPTFKELFPELKKILKKNTVVIYNAKYDVRLLIQTLQQDVITDKAKIHAECAMIMYSQFIGEWASFKDEYKWQKLPGGDHSAIGDCRATLEIIKEMANSELLEIPKKWFQFRK